MLNKEGQMNYLWYDHIIGKVYDLTQDNMNAMIKHIEELTEERTSLFGSMVDRLDKALTTTSENNHKYVLKNVDLRGRIEKMRAVLSIDHDTMYPLGKCDLCDLLRSDYEADENS